MPVNVITKKNTTTTSSAAFTNKPPLLASNSLPTGYYDNCFLEGLMSPVFLAFPLMLVAFLLLSLAAAGRTTWLRFRPSAAARLALVFAGTLLLFPTAVMAEPGQRPGSTDHAAP